MYSSNATRPGDDAHSDVARLCQSARAFGSSRPRVGLFLFDCADPQRIRQTLGRIPKGLDQFLKDVVLVVSKWEPSDDVTREVDPARRFNVRIHRTPRNAEQGAARKSAFEHALREEFAFVITMRGDGVHPPELLPGLLCDSLEAPDALVVASRFSRRLRTLREGVPPHRLLAHVATTGWQNRVLGLRLHDYHSGLRVYPLRGLQRIPFQLNADDRRFDAQILIQFRALGSPIRERAVSPAWREYASAGESIRALISASGSALAYRLHQLHIRRHNCFFVDQDVRYRLKASPASSHSQIVGAIQPGSRVLDLGCSRGLLAGPLREKNVRVTGVDVGPPDTVSDLIEGYYQRNLEEPLELPTGRMFDYVVASDVIEHLRNRVELLRGARRYLKEDGRLLISTGNVAIWFYRLSLLFGRFEYGPRGILDETHVHLFTRASFEREVEKAGFRVVRRRVTSLPFELVFESTGRSRFIRALEQAYFALARLWPTLFAYQHILEAQIITLDDDATTASREP